MKKLTKVIGILLLCFLFAKQLQAREPKYPVSDIPEDLKNNAKCVIRSYEDIFEIKSIDHATEKIKIAITVLNKNGIQNSIFTQYYDKFHRISKIDATIYDASGFKGKPLRNEDILDYSAISNFSVYEDNRVKYIDPKEKEVPFTIVYSYQVVYNGLLSYPRWEIFPDFNVSVENSKFCVKCPSGLTFRYWPQNLNIKPDSSNIDDNNVYVWQVSNLPAINIEPFSLPVEEYLPALFIAPDNFKIGGYSGNADTWQTYGKWDQTLNKDQNNLPEETKVKLKEFVKDEPDDFHKIEKIYRFLQDNTRYVSIQKGIGDWKPIDAETVDRLKYGDCKALSNYMKSMLEAIGIRSIFTLASAEKDEARINKNFPSNQFNHALLCVPNNSDTIWLECTNQFDPAGYIGTFTDDRDVLLVDEDGGHLVHTPVYTMNDNVQTQTALVNLDPSVLNNTTVSNTYKGTFYDKMLIIALSDEKDRKEFLYKTIDIPSFDIASFSYDITKNRLPTLKVNINLDIINYTTLVGTNMLFNPNLMNHVVEIPKKTETRMSDIFIRRSEMQIDSIRYILPSNYKPGSIPAKKVISSKFGEYKNEVTSKGNEILYIRKLIMNKGLFPKNLYPELIDFFEKISTADAARISIKKI